MRHASSEDTAHHMIVIGSSNNEGENQLLALYYNRHTQAVFGGARYIRALYNRAASFRPITSSGLHGPTSIAPASQTSPLFALLSGRR